MTKVPPSQRTTQSTSLQSVSSASSTKAVSHHKSGRCSRARSRAASAPTDDRKSRRVHLHRRGPRPRRGGAAGAAARRSAAAGRPVSGRRRRHRIFPATPRASGPFSGPSPTRSGRSSILNRGISRTRRSRATPRSTRGGGRLVSPSRPSGARKVLRAHRQDPRTQNAPRPRASAAPCEPAAAPGASRAGAATTEFSAARRGAQDRRRGRYQLLARRRQFLIEGFRAPAVAVGRPSVEARAWKACASPPPRIARPELRQGPASTLQPAVWRLAALRDRYRPISHLAPLGHDQFLGSPRAGGRSAPSFSLRPDARDPSAPSDERCASAGRRRPR